MNRKAIFEKRKIDMTFAQMLKYTKSCSQITKNQHTQHFQKRCCSRVEWSWQGAQWIFFTQSQFSFRFSKSLRKLFATLSPCAGGKCFCLAEKRKLHYIYKTVLCKKYFFTALRPLSALSSKECSRRCSMFESRSFAGRHCNLWPKEKISHCVN